MKAAVVKAQGLLAVEDVPDPEVGPGQVLVKVAYCGICGSDVHLYNLPEIPSGVRLGHEWCGIVASLGEGVEGPQIGDHVIGHGFGAFAEYMVVQAEMVGRIPPALPDEQAPLFEPLGNGLHVVRRSDLRAGDSAVVLGAGPIGLCTLAAIRLTGARSTIAVEPMPKRAALAKHLGADLVLDPTQVDVQTEVWRQFPQGPDFVFECSGVPSTLQQSLVLVRLGGQVMLIGLPFEPVTVRPGAWLNRDLTIKTSFGYVAEEAAFALDLLAQRRVDGQALITGIVPLSEIQDAFQMLSRPNEHAKVLVKP